MDLGHLIAKEEQYGKQLVGFGWARAQMAGAT